MKTEFLPTTMQEARKRGWDSLDVILVTGDAYVDHPSYCAAVIGRVLEDAGFKVGIIAQPDWAKLDDFMKLGRPRLFFGVTAGNLDSMVANYTANKKIRGNDDYSPGGRSGLRPDRASIMYTNKIRSAFKNSPIVLGGIEASLRRLAHYDYWSEKVRRSIILDAKADILVYEMGERQVLEIARRLNRGEDIKSLNDIRGTVIIRNNTSNFENFVSVPSFEEVSSDKDKYAEAFRAIYGESDPYRGNVIIQKHGERFIVQLPPQKPLTTAELDNIYELDYVRTWHPAYGREGGVPGFETVRFSVISHRGCAGECSFCSLYFHQGRIIQSRSKESVLREIRTIAALPYFKGTITDIGGPTANLYAASCPQWAKSGTCKDRHCLVPAKCKDLSLGYTKTLNLWKEALAIPGVKHVFIGSGVRYDLLVDAESDEYLKELCRHHVSGQLKAAPEHIASSVVKLMNKPNVKLYEEFVKRFSAANKSLKKKQYIVNYFISSHPGAGLDEALELALYLLQRGIHPEQVQDFLPLPMTASECMYYTGKDPFTGERVYVSRGARERRLQRALIQYNNPHNRKLIVEALQALHKTNLRGLFFSREGRRH